MKRVAKLIIGRYLTFLPLIIFLLTYKFSSSWSTSFTIGGVVSCAYLLLVFYEHIRHDLIMTGVNCFLIGGAVMSIFKIRWLGKVYGYFGFSTILVWIFIVGLIATILSPEGFIGVKHKNKQLIKIFSIALLVGVLLAIAYSMYFIKIIYGPSVVKAKPQLLALSFLFLFLVRWFLVKHLKSVS